MGPSYGRPPSLFTGGGRKEEGGGKEGGGRIPPFLFPSPLSFSSRFSPYGGRTSPLWLVRFPSWPIRPISFVGVSGTPSGDPICTWYPSEHFRCPNTIVLYTNLYMSTISRLLVMSVISSGTPNNIRSPNHITHLIVNCHRTLSMRTLRVRELCRHDRDTSLVNNQ